MNADDPKPTRQLTPEQLERLAAAREKALEKRRLLGEISRREKAAREEHRGRSKWTKDNGAEAGTWVRASTGQVGVVAAVHGTDRVPTYWQLVFEDGTWQTVSRQDWDVYVPLLAVPPATQSAVAAAYRAQAGEMVRDEGKLQSRWAPAAVEARPGAGEQAS